jgi:hypothetical protein
MRGLTWVRLYVDLVNHPEAQSLSLRAFKTMVNAWCIAGTTGGDLPALAELAWLLRIPLGEAEEDLRELERAGLIERKGDVYRPHNWDSRQAKGVSSAERTRRWREKKAADGGGNESGSEASEFETELGEFEQRHCDVSGDVTRDVQRRVTKRLLEKRRVEKNREEIHAQSPLRADSASTCSDSPKPKRVPRASTAEADKRGEWFDEWYSLYPRKVAVRKAEKAFAKVATGAAEFDAIMEGLRRQLPGMLAGDSQFIPYPASWLNAQRWLDETGPGRAGVSASADDLPTVRGWK